MNGASQGRYGALGRMRVLMSETGSPASGDPDLMRGRTGASWWIPSADGAESVSPSNPRFGASSRRARAVA